MLKRLAALPVLLAALVALGCASAGDVGDQAKNLTCLAARVELQRCAAGAEKDSDRCLYAQIVAAGCATAEASAEQGVFAAAPSIPGSGYVPRSLAVAYRAIPGGPVLRAVGSLAGDPWSTACAGKGGADLSACLRSRFLTQSPAVCAEYQLAFGVDSCGTPGGGWALGPSTERWGSAVSALRWFCENDPAFIGSGGRVAGYDCAPLALEWTRLGAFGGEYVVSEWIRRTEIPPAPTCGNHRHDPGETCASCPADIGACPPPPPPSDGKIDCSGLRIPAPNAPQWVAVAPRTASAGSAEVQEVECRSGTLSPPAPLPPPAPACIPLEERRTACRCAGWTLVTQRKTWCASLCLWAKGLPTC